MAVLGQSSLGTMRVNAARLNFHNPLAYISINGIAREGSVRRSTIQIRPTINNTPDTATMRVWGFTPTALQDLKIYSGSTAATSLIFGGTIERVTQVMEDSQANVAYDLECLDYAWQMDMRLVFKAYTNVSASVIAADLIASNTSGYTTHNVQSGLPAVSITFIGIYPSGALTQLAQAVSAATGAPCSWKMSYTKDLRFSTNSAYATVPDTITAATITKDTSPTVRSDGAQVRTRMIVIGKGTTASAAAAIGDVLLTIQDSSLFPASGTAYVIGQKLTYTGISGGVTTLATPTAGIAYLAAASIATGININTVAGVSTVTHTAHGYSTGQQIVITTDSTSGGTGSYTSRYTITVVNANSYTLNSGPAGTTTGTSLVIRPGFLATATAKIGTATVTCTAHGFATGMKVRGYYALNALGGTVSSYQALLGPITVVDANTFTCAMSGYPADVTFAVIAATSGSLVGTYSYRLTDNANGSESLGSSATTVVVVEQVGSVSGTYGFSTTAGTGLLLNKNYTYGFSAVTADGETSVLTTQRVFTGGGAGSVAGLLTAIKLTNDPRVSARNIWRTPADGADSVAALRYVGTISDDTTQTFTDTVTDANLGAFAPTVNTTGGAVKLTGIAVSANTRSSGREVYRPVASGTTYQHVGTVNGTTATTFTDTASDATQAAGVALPTTTATASLTGIPASGVGSIAAAINVGDAVRPSLQRDDAAAQAALAASGFGDGIIEDKVDDPTLATTAAMQAAGDAALVLFKAVETKSTFSARDYKLQVGSTVPVNIAAPTSFSGSFVAQAMTIDQIGMPGGPPYCYPLRTVDIGSTWFTLQNLLRDAVSQ